MSSFFKKVSYPVKEKQARTTLTAIVLMTILSLYAVGFGLNSLFFTTAYAVKNKALTLGGDSKAMTKIKDNKNADTGSDASPSDRGDKNIDTNLKETTSDQQQSDQKNQPEQVQQPTLPTQTPESTQLITSTLNSKPNMASVPEGKNCATNLSERPNPIQYLTYFNCGHVSTLKNGTTLRQFSLIASENNTIPISDINTNDPVLFDAWTFNSTIPGPTMRMTEGDHVQITVYNSDSSRHAHSMHMHSIHSGYADGVMGPAGTIPPGGHFTYSFVASPYGVYPYHCHVDPLVTHINHGLYGAMIIDPKVPRTPAKEMVMLMNGYNLVDDFAPPSGPLQHPPTATELRTNFGEATQSDEGGGADNQIYTVNGDAFLYRDQPIQLVTGQQYRIYLVNMLEFDLANSFHLHGNMFEYYPSGTAMNPAYKTDIVTLGQGDRGIMEFTYDQPGMYMFHAHVTRFTNLGWMGMFNVQDKSSAATTNMASSMPSMQQIKTEETGPNVSDSAKSSPPFPFIP
jgi:FtsP/CotA-like multicopper oxidase with cupredoxin domain